MVTFFSFYHKILCSRQLSLLPPLVCHSYDISCLGCAAKMLMQEAEDQHYQQEWTVLFPNLDSILIKRAII